LLIPEWIVGEIAELLAVSLDARQECWQPGDILGPEDHVDVRSTLKEVFPLLLGDAAAHPNNQLRVFAFEPFELAELAINLLLSLIANATGIQQDQVSTACLAGNLVTEGNQNASHALRLILIHLAAVGNDCRAFRLHA
jgi:hypothetical protein